jgi:uncharacterized membrane protein YphA (DoxX/SURF4 family)
LPYNGKIAIFHHQNTIDNRLLEYNMLKKIINTDNSKATIIIRLLVATVFLSEGIQKFLFPALRGAGRFEKIGLPSPEFLGNFVGAFEIICGALILIGLFSRLASIPLIIIMLVAMATTKSEIYFEKGFWEMLHHSRTDWAMLLATIFIIIKGSGLWSLDKRLMKNEKDR